MREMTGLRIQEVEELVWRWMGVRKQIVKWLKEGFTERQIKAELRKLKCNKELLPMLMQNLSL